MNLKKLYHFQFLENSLKNNMAIPSIMGSQWGCSWIFCWSMEMGRFITFTPSNSSFDSVNVLFLGLGGSWIGEPASFASWSLSGQHSSAVLVTSSKADYSKEQASSPSLRSPDPVHQYSYYQGQLYCPQGYAMSGWPMSPSGPW